MSTAAVAAPTEPAPETMNEKVEPVAEPTPAAPSATPQPAPAPAGKSETETVTAVASTAAARDYKTGEDESGNAKTFCVAHPDPSAVLAPAPELTDDQLAKYEELLTLCKEITEVPNAKGKPEKSPLTDSERMWLTRECLFRYLKATKWVVADAKKRLEGTLTWRREWGLEKHTADYIEVENETGKQVVFGFDNESRPCLYLNPARQNTEKSNRQVEHLTFMLEKVIDLMPPGVETLALLIDFKSASSGQNATIGQGRLVMEILQMHYPERLGRALVVNIPWWANLFLKAIWPLIDPVTRPKLKFNEPMAQHVPKSQLLKEFDGDIELPYDHKSYWPNFIKLCADRKQRYEERWRANGGQIGESEFYLRGGEKSKPLTSAAEPSVEQVTEEIQKVTV